MSPFLQRLPAIIDIKTFSNALGKPINRALASALANNRYDVQAIVYDDAVTQAKAMLRKLKSSCLYGPRPSDDWLLSFAACEQHTFAFLFIEQGPVTNVRLREFLQAEREGASENAYWTGAIHSYRHAVARYATFMAKFGPDKPWIEEEPARMRFNDTDLPLWLFDDLPPRGA